MKKKTAGEFRAGFVQFDIKRGNVAHNLKQAIKGIENLARKNTRLAVLPEMWTSSFVPGELARLADESEAAMQVIRKAARRHKMVIIGSSYERVRASVYNTAYVIDADGSIAGQYRKIHLFSPGDEHVNFQSGAGPLLVQTAASKIGITICYDLRFPELYRHLAEAGAEIIVVPAQWPDARITHWETLLRARAIENQVYIIGCNRTGKEKKSAAVTLTFPGASAVIDPWGQTLATKKGGYAALSAEISRAEIDRVRGLIPVWKDRRPKSYK